MWNYRSEEKGRIFRLTIHNVTLNARCINRACRIGGCSKAAQVLNHLLGVECPADTSWKAWWTAYLWRADVWPTRVTRIMFPKRTSTLRDVGGFLYYLSGWMKLPATQRRDSGNGLNNIPGLQLSLIAQRAILEAARHAGTSVAWVP